MLHFFLFIKEKGYKKKNIYDYLFLSKVADHKTTRKFWLQNKTHCLTKHQSKYFRYFKTQLLAKD